MCKTARVKLDPVEITPGAIVTIRVRGDVADVEAAVEAGAAAARRIGELLCRHVIPAADPELEPLLADARGGRASQRKSGGSR